jgi:tetratricopeptide (TPR) repeat protein
MSTLQQRLDSAVQLRETGRHEEARASLLELHTEAPDDPQINYQCAWIHDLLGLEREAIPFYEAAVNKGLQGDDLKSAWLGMGSTHRCIGDYQKAIDIFHHALTVFPDGHEFKVFLAMAYHNIHEHEKAMELLLISLVETSQDDGIQRYQRAIRFYSDKLNQTW